MPTIEVVPTWTLSRLPLEDELAEAQERETEKELLLRTLVVQKEKYRRLVDRGLSTTRM
jgi:hypothetical protein